MKGQLLHKVFHTLTEAFQNCLRRFPSTVCFVLALTVYLVYLVATDMDDDRKLVMVLGYYFSIGTLLSLTLHLWSEEIKSKIKGVIVHIVMHVLLIADAVYLYSLSPEQSLTEIGTEPPFWHCGFRLSSFHSSKKRMTFQAGTSLHTRLALLSRPMWWGLS